MFVNPRQPNLADYTTFLFKNVGIPSIFLPPDFTGTGTVEQGETTLTIDTVTTGALYDRAVMSDASGNIPVNSFICEQLTGAPPSGGVGTYQLSLAATGTDATPQIITAANGWIVTTLAIAIETVNLVLNVAGNNLYVLAVYNLATDRLINFANDVPDQTYFQDQRTKYRINEVSVGVASSASDQGTSDSILNPEFMKTMTFQDLQTLKSPWGRTYMGIAQSYGPNIWSLS